MSITEVPFGITVSREDSVVIVSVDGALDADTSPTFRNILLDLVASQGNLSLVVDLSSLSFLDSTAIGVICTLRRALAARNGHLVVREASPAVRRIFETSDLATILSAATP